MRKQKNDIDWELCREELQEGYEKIRGELVLAFHQVFGHRAHFGIYLNDVPPRITLNLPINAERDSSKKNDKRLEDFAYEIGAIADKHYLRIFFFSPKPFKSVAGQNSYCELRPHYNRYKKSKH